MEAANNAIPILLGIAVLLPPRYHGYYHDHPRLLELLQASNTP